MKFKTTAELSKYNGAIVDVLRGGKVYGRCEISVVDDKNIFILSNHPELDGCNAPNKKGYWFSYVVSTTLTDYEDRYSNFVTILKPQYSINVEPSVELVQIKRQLEALQTQLAALEEVNRDKELPKLTLSVGSDDCLDIRYKGEYVGWIHPNGYCSIIMTQLQLNTYEEWVEDGKPVDSTPVRWKGGSYNLGLSSRGIVLVADSGRGIIYNFSEARPVPGCTDPNIRRTLENNTPLMR